MNDVGAGTTTPARTESRTQPHDGEGSASAATDGRSLTTLVKELGADSGRLVREEIALAKAEMREKMDVYRRGTARMAVGGSILVAALLVLLFAVNRGLTVLLGQAMAPELAVWVAPLVLAVVLGLVGWSLVRRSKKQMAAEGLAPRSTMETLREEKRWVQEEVR